MERTEAIPAASDQQRRAGEAETAFDLSVVIPVSERWENLPELYEEYGRVVESSGQSFEFVIVLDGPNTQLEGQLTRLAADRNDLKVIVLNRWVGEASALSVGFRQARGRKIVTLPPYLQVESSEISRLIAALDEDDDLDMVISWRNPRIDPSFNRWQGRMFHWFVRKLTGTPYHDVACGVRAMKRVVAEEVPLYGDLHRFFPILAYERGFRVAELSVRQSQRDAGRRIYRPGIYLRRLLDILTLFFLFKFTKKPLRFFGLIGTALGAAGVVITGYLGIYRLFGFGGIAGRPLLILGVLLIVLGVQLFSIGLLGEILIFTHGGRRRDYTVDRFLR